MLRVTSTQYANELERILDPQECILDGLDCILQLLIFHQRQDCEDHPLVAHALADLFGAALKFLGDLVSLVQPHGNPVDTCPQSGQFFPPYLTGPRRWRRPY